MIQVRKCRYRGQDGWKVGGYVRPERTGWPVSIFFEDEATARREAAALRADPDHVVSFDEAGSDTPPGE